jgi:hypothetical protein
MPTIELFFYGFTLWLGAYLLARGSRKATVHLTGWGLIAYAIALATQIVFDQFILIILLIPALLWIGAALHLLPEEDNVRPVLIRIWMVSSIPLAILTLVNAWFAALIILALMICAGMIAKLAFDSSRSPFGNTFALLAVIALFVTLSAGSLILPLNWIPVSGAWHCLLRSHFSWHHHHRLGCLLMSESIRAHLVRSFVAPSIIQALA